GPATARLARVSFRPNSSISSVVSDIAEKNATKYIKLSKIRASLEKAPQTLKGLEGNPYAKRIEGFPGFMQMDDCKLPEGFFGASNPGIRVVRVKIPEGGSIQSFLRQHGLNPNNSFSEGLAITRQASESIPDFMCRVRSKLQSVAEIASHSDNYVSFVTPEDCSIMEKIPKYKLVTGALENILKQNVQAYLFYFIPKKLIVVGELDHCHGLDPQNRRDVIHLGKTGFHLGPCVYDLSPTDDGMIFITIPGGHTHTFFTPPNEEPQHILSIHSEGDLDELKARLKLEFGEKLSVSNFLRSPYAKDLSSEDKDYLQKNLHSEITAYDLALILEAARQNCPNITKDFKAIKEANAWNKVREKLEKVNVFLFLTVFLDQCEKLGIEPIDDSFVDTQPQYWHLEKMWKKLIPKAQNNL
ncbi:MAG: hypothetical protein AAF621_07110, partial [Pseudomonadota bacterium]